MLRARCALRGGDRGARRNGTRNWISCGGSEGATIAVGNPPRPAETTSPTRRNFNKTPSAAASNTQARRLQNEHSRAACGIERCGACWREKTLAATTARTTKGAARGLYLFCNDAIGQLQLYLNGVGMRRTRGPSLRCCARVVCAVLSGSPVIDIRCGATCSRGISAPLPSDGRGGANPTNAWGALGTYPAARLVITNQLNRTINKQRQTITKQRN